MTDDRRTRPFRWLDLAILGLSLAVAVAAAVADDRQFLGTMPFSGSRKIPWEGMPDWARALELPAKRVQSDFGAFLGVISLGVGLVTFRRFPARRLGLPTPGVAATAAATAVLLTEIGIALITIAYRNFWHRVTPSALVEVLHGPEFHPSAGGAPVTGAILGTWAYLALARGWRARGDWRDYLGRWLGWVWLSTIACHAVFIFIWG